MSEQLHIYFRKVRTPNKSSSSSASSRDLGVNSISIEDLLYSIVRAKPPAFWAWDEWKLEKAARLGTGPEEKNARRKMKRVLSVISSAAKWAGIPFDTMRKAMMRNSAAFSEATVRAFELYSADEKYLGLQEEMMRNIRSVLESSTTESIREIIFHDAFLVESLCLKNPFFIEQLIDLIFEKISIGQQRTLSIVVPSVSDRPQLESALQPLLQLIYRRHELPIEIIEHPEEKFLQHEEYQEFIRRLFSPQDNPSDPISDHCVSIVEAHTYREELRATVNQVKLLLQQGVRKDKIAIIVPAALQDALIAQLQREKVMVVRRPKILLQFHESNWMSDSLLRMLHELYELLDENLPTTDTIRWYSSNFLQASFDNKGMQEFIQHIHLGQFMIDGGIHPHILRSITDGEPNEWHWTMYRDCVSLLEPILRLPKLAPVTIHARELKSLIEHMFKFPVRWGQQEANDWEEPYLAQETKVWQATMEVLETFANEPSKEKSQEIELTGQEFIEFLANSVERDCHWNRQEQGEIEIGDLDSLCAHSASHVLMIGCNVDSYEGQLLYSNDSELTDVQREILNQNLRKNIVPRSSYLAEQESIKNPFQFYWATSNAEFLYVSRSRENEMGRQVNASELWNEVLRAAGKKPSSPAQWYSENERWALAVLDKQTTGMESNLWETLSKNDPERARSLELRLNVEKERALSFFAGNASHSLVNGNLYQKRGELLHALPGTKNRPLSASSIERYAQCGFRFFAHDILRVKPPRTITNELDALEWGQIQHKILKQFLQFRTFPLLSESDELHALSIVTDELAREYQANPLILVQLERLFKELQRFIISEIHRENDGFTPVKFEYSVSPQEFLLAGEPVFFHGILDRIDRRGNDIRILDYKSGALSFYERILRNELLKSSFQLPLYQLLVQKSEAVDASASVGHIESRYSSIRDAKQSSPCRPVSEQEFVVAVESLRLRMKGGDFRALPKTCDGCHLEFLCRIPPLPNTSMDGESVDE